MWSSQRPIPLDTLASRLTQALPDGLDVVAVVPLMDRAPALQEAIGAVEWELELFTADPAGDASPDAMAVRIDALLAAPTLPLERQRKGKTTTDDIRPAIRRIRVLGPAEHPHLAAPGSSGNGTLIGAELATRPTSLRPAELVAVLGPELHEGRVRRIRQWIERDGERYDPLSVDARIATEARAS